MSEAYENRLSKSEQAKTLLKTHLEEVFGRDTVELEHRFCERKWRFDAIVECKGLAFEIEGGIFMQGAHTRGAHYMSDMEKYNRAALIGWRVLRFTPNQVLKGEALAWLKTNIAG